jgi:hypothetical protein
MSEKIGNAIPPPLRFELGTEQGADQLCRAVLLVTADDDGCPRVAVLSYAEVGALDERRISIKVNEGTRTHHNLAAGRDATLWCVLDSAAYSLRGSVSGSADIFELTINEVLRDFYAESPMMSGPMYRRPVK